MEIDCVEGKNQKRINTVLKAIISIIIIALALPWVGGSIYWVGHAIGTRWAAYTTWVEGFFK